MALNIPNISPNIDTFLKGADTGNNLLYNIMQNKNNNTIHPSGDVANAMFVQQLKNQYGENDPRYIEAKRAHDMILQGHESLMGYRNTLNKTAGMRATSPLGKEIAEGQGHGAQDIINGTPSGGAGYANPRTQEEKEAYERSINKKTSDVATRNKLNFATNLDKTRNAINPDDLTRYSGLKGFGQYLYDSAQAMKGNPSDAYIAHQKALTAASLMRDQMRQFYGDSIQPSALKRLDELANPSTPWTDSKVAKAKLEQLNKILDNETQTYKEKGTSPIHLGGLNFDEKKGSFSVGNSQENINQGKNNQGNVNLKKDYLDNLEPQLIKINPAWTAKNIRATASATNMTPDQVIDRLRAKYKGAK